MPRTPAGGINPAPTNKFVLWTNRDGPAHPGGRRAGCPHPAAPRAAANPRGRIWNPPYNQRRARGQPENRKPCVTSNPCRGRCSHRPGGPYAARMPAGGMPSSRRTPRRREPPRADMESAPTTNGGRAANRETANPALHQTPVGDDARIVPGDLTPRERPRADMESAPTTNGGCAANRETAVLAL